MPAAPSSASEQLRRQWANPEYAAAMRAALARGRATQAARARARRTVQGRLTDRRRMPGRGPEALLRDVVRLGVEPSALATAAALIAELDRWALERAEAG